MKVIGYVYCLKCYDTSLKSSDRHLLEGATVEATCEGGRRTTVAYGKTDACGKYLIEVKGFDYLPYGGKACSAKLYKAPERSPCTIPTSIHGGDEEARLHVKSKTYYGVVLQAKSFAYAESKECSLPHHHTNPQRRPILHHHTMVLHHHHQPTRHLRPTPHHTTAPYHQLHTSVMMYMVLMITNPSVVVVVPNRFTLLFSIA